ncbi:chemotaxis protein CheR [Methylobacillus gramineus]|uniref:CheR family methyltransferase n=1 Tax=Methylobacillus gramineus TaxID=755169 RepID=UPI001CFF642A|nr:CheR family methyltransferase [Methylobacillus gramineus]MCB5183807.1 chemotaxis protein CheR [Methylobacillus gramineus]
MKPITSVKSGAGKEFDFTAEDFSRVRKMIYQVAGISLAESKHEMVYSRLARRLRATGISNFQRYLDQLEATGDAEEWEAFTNALTTNLTSFFRENHHFPILTEHIRKTSQPISIWCCASSTGEEPYSLAITVCEAFGTLKPPVEIVATDIDTNVLATAASGVYPYDRIEKLPIEQKKKFFLKGTGAQQGFVRVRDDLRKLITFKPLNLLANSWPVTGPFDAIFCRNVMIYFDKPTQSTILKKFAPLMKPDGLLFAGHSENFLYATDAFRLRGKTVYELNRHLKSGTGG